MSADKNLIFFDDKGHSLNFNYNTSTSRYEGKLIFDHNSAGTFKNIGLNVFEKVKAFQYIDPTHIGLEKLQLFNHYGILFQSNTNLLVSITKIEPSNTDSTFYSKWIYSNGIEHLYTTGSKFKFDSNIFEFNTVSLWTVVATKKDAIMIISNVDNSTFTSLYASLISLPSSYIGKTISGVNTISFNQYFDQSYNPNYPSWSEPTFFTKWYDNDKITISNSKLNDGVYTIESNGNLDDIYVVYKLNNVSLSNTDLKIEVKLKTDLPLIYTGGLSFNTNGRIDFLSTIPNFFKPGLQFQVINSGLNNIFLTVSNILQFNPLTQYVIGDQVLYNNIIYQCILDYTSANINSTAPTNITYWSTPDYLYVDEPLNNEYLSSTLTYLTTNVFSFITSYDTSDEITIASAFQKYKQDLLNLGITMTLDSIDGLQAKLNLPSTYVEVKFYIGSTDITSSYLNYSRLVQITESLTNEDNYDISDLYKRDIVFTDLDEFGLRININKQEYYIDTDFVYIGLNVDLVQTVSNTIKDFISRYFFDLIRLGILIEGVYSGVGTSPFANTIRLTTVYPNIPLVYDVVVGSTANFYINHSSVSFNQIGSVLNVKINNKSYIQLYSSSISETLDKWHDKYADILLDFGIIINVLNNTIYFSLNDDTVRFSYEILVGKSFKPSIEPFIINNHYYGNIGVVVASNRVITDKIDVQDFETGGFATGMLTNINNSDYPLNNQEYNILHLNPDSMILSYQGPFWGNVGNTNSGGFLSWAFNSGFGYDANSAYNLTPSLVLTYSVTTVSAATSSTSIIYNDSNKSIYITPDTTNRLLLQVDSDNIIDGFTISGSYSYSKIVDNKINGRLYALHSGGFISFDPNSNTVLSTTTMSQTFDIAVNQDNGDVYVTDNNALIKVYDISNTLVSTINSYTFPQYITYNKYEKCMVFTNNSTIVEIDGQTRTGGAGYSLSSFSTFLYYNQLNGRVYGFDGTFFSYYNSVVNYLPSVLISTTAKFEISPDLDYMYISSDNNILYVLDANDNIISQSVINLSTTSYSPYDRKLYMTDSIASRVLVYDTIDNYISSTISISGTYSNSVYSWSTNAIYLISSNNLPLLEISSSLPYIPATFSSATYSIVSDQYYGSLDPNYTFVDDIWLNTREFIRKPRHNFLDKGENSVSYKWIWEEDITPEIFLFDFSGDQLPTSGSYKYTGPKPLDVIYLNTEPNKDITKVGLSQFQQTVFGEITNELSYLDSENDISFVPTPLQIYIGFSSDEEGVKSSTLLLKKMEDVSLDITVDTSNNNTITLRNVIDLVNGDYGIIELSNLSTETFSGHNLRPNQIIRISLVDNQNEFGQYVSLNNGKSFKIKTLYTRQIVVEYISDVITEESNIIYNFPINNISTAVHITYLDFNITVLESELLRLQVYGQTEIEDIRYKINLNNVGHNLMPEDAFIFKNHPIDEEGVDWNILNNKRKEMLLSLGDIFNYIGSYKSIINSINLFGYNDLELYEYYKNINTNSSNYGKLIKVEIPDIFDNTVEGWTEKNYLKIHLPNESFDETNLFNLTYKITDKEGNFVLGYSVKEAQIKLAGLKKWLHKNVIPLTHKILDVTGRTDFVQTNYITHQCFKTNILNIHNSITPVTGEITESYVLPVNTGSTVYNVVVELFQKDGNNKPDYYNIDIKTYQNYPEWDVFKTYQVGDLVRYYNLLYVSVLTNNKLNNPRKYLDTSTWSANIDYLFGQIVEYNRRFYQYALEFPTPSYMLDTLSLLSDPEDFIIDDGKIYVVNQGVDKLTIIDIFTYQVLSTVNINNSPIQIIKNLVNGYFYILGIMDMVVFDPSTGLVVTTINFSFSTTDDFCINQTQGTIYVPLVDNTIKVINTSNIITGTITLSNISNNIIWNKTDDRVYAGLADGTTISVIDSFTDTFLYDVTAGFDSTTGQEMKFNEINSNVYYLDSSFNLLKISNMAFNTVYASGVTDFVISSISGYVYVIDSSNNLVVLDTTDTVITTLSVGYKGKIQLDEESEIVYISDNSSNALIVIDVKTLTINQVLYLNDSSDQMLFDQTSNSLYGLINTTDNIFKVKLKNESDPPYLNNDWNDVTEWQKVDLKPIQVIKEYRDGDNLLPFNFTVDSNIDPFIVLSVTSDNGYGQIYNDRKSYELYISEDASASIKSLDYVQNSNP